MAIRPPKHNSQGYTLLEMLAVVGIMSVIIGFAVPSLLALNKPLRDGTLQFKTHLSLMRSKAISSNQAYRIRPKFPQTSQYTGQKYQNTPHNFIVEYAANCQVTTYGTGLPGTADGWQSAPQFDLDLPETIGVSNTPVTKQALTPTAAPTTITSATLTLTPANTTLTPTTVTADPYLNWDICYDNRGIVYRPVTLTLKDFQGNNKAVASLIDVQKVGGLVITTSDKNSNSIAADSQGNPVF